MAFFFPSPTPIFPVLRPAWTMKWKPTFASKAVTLVSGYETRSACQAWPLWEFELTYELIGDRTQNIIPDTQFTAEFEQIVGLFLVCRGQYGRFYFSCPWDKTRTAQFMAFGDGTTLEFPLLRTLGTDPFTAFLEQVGGVDYNVALVIYLDGVVLPESGNYQISATKNSIVFTSPPASGVEITVTFGYYYLCRFLENIQDFENFFHHMWTVRSLKFRSSKL